MNAKTSSRILVLAGALVAAASCAPDASRRDRLDEAFLRISALEDARPVDGRELTALIEATHATEVFLRRTAYRALGRLENPALLHEIERGLSDPSPSVRAAAANAVAQAHHTSSGAPALHALEEALASEADPDVRGTLARSIGRLRLDDSERDHVIDLLVDATFDHGEDAPLAALLGATLGLESVARARPRTSLGARAERRLTELTRYGSARPYILGPGRVRTLSVATLGTSGSMSQPLMVQAIRDDHPQVGATAFRFIRDLDEAYYPDITRRAVSNASLQTIIEGFRFIESQPRSAMSCQYLLAGAPVLPPGAPIRLPLSVRIAAIDGLAEPCPDFEAQRATLREIANDLPQRGRGWQTAVHALNALARVSPPDAAATLSRHSDHASPFVRAWSARTAAILGNRNVLRNLADDPDPNVRTAAIQGLFGLDGHLVDELLIEQLEASDPQLLMTASRLLTGTSRPDEAAAAALSAFGRISGAGRETWRDPRVSLLTLLQEVGSLFLVPELEPYLNDYDPLIAEMVAEMIRGWTGSSVNADPIAARPLPFPSVEELQAMDGATVVLHMQDLGEIHIVLLPYEALTNAYRFYRLASEGYFDGLTFHRWARNFVIQGGSPAANEYAGDGPFTRDEVGLLGHWRGFVGISTRGHDTGDGQIFVNLVDNVRLDHQYTVIGAVTVGMDVVDDVLEGSVIERVEVRPAS